ncbi:MAG: hypothetical protein WAO98_09370 [Alphaproteobacteria bacterium]
MSRSKGDYINMPSDIVEPTPEHIRRASPFLRKLSCGALHATTVQMTRSFRDARHLIERGVNSRQGEFFDFNSLPATAKQAALSLENEHKVKLEIRDGRTIVTSRPGLLARVFALG